MAVLHLELTTLTNHLKLCFRHDPPRGYHAGKARMVEMVARMFACSRDRANRLVNHLEKQGHICATKAGGGVRWHFHPLPSERC